MANENHTAGADRAEGTDALCFTAGRQGIPFFAGVVHAWLASDRTAPLVTAGISSGALSASALVRACHKRDAARNLTPPEQESHRWTWFRQYLDAITNQPLKPIWDAIPDPDDYFADKPPVKDLSVDQLPPEMQRTEARSRRHYFRLVKLGLWIAGLRVSISEIATCIVRRVRLKERYAMWPLQGIMLAIGGLVIAVKVLVHLCLSPQFILERTEEGKLSLPRPLFGWGWLIPVLLAVDVVFWILTGAGYLAAWLAQHFAPSYAVLRGLITERLPHFDTVINWWSNFVLRDQWSGLMGTAQVIGLVTVGVIVWMAVFPDVLIGYLARQLGIHRALLDSYTLRRKLFELFAEAGVPARVSERLLLVAAPLQKFEGEFGKQVWFEPQRATVIEALLASMAIPGLFPPVKSKPGWIEGDGGGLDLIDGAMVRQNPLPALFRWLKKNPSIAEQLCGKTISDASIHLVYGVPIRPIPASSAHRFERVDLVDAANIGRDLARRRDSRMEFRQTNFISELAHYVREAGGDPKGVYPIFADEIAPDCEIAFENNLAPERQELLEVTAAGCRAALETLHRHKLASLCSGRRPIPCSQLLSQLAPRRAAFIHLSAPGLPEVCRHCTKMLSPLPDPVAEAKSHEQRWVDRIPLAKYAHLAPDDGSMRPPASHRPRIVFLAAGGVFRGAFHAGVIGAMQAARIKPDLIVGASVGTLMGGALGAISTLHDDSSKQKLLGQLCLTFLEVDRRVALTKVLKNAAKQLGTRGRAVHLSPAEMRKAVRNGTRSDPGFAVAGAPSILIDAISTLFLIPHKDTRDIAAQFVAGRIAYAMKLFWKVARSETLQRLEIDTAIIGTSLLEERARTLLVAQGFDNHYQIDAAKDQPYPGTSLSATASDLSRSQPLLLPRDLDDTTVYDFVQAGLSSSAFRPRQQAEVQPGRGATDIPYADGGMFDNLPFFPAIEVLSVVQRNWRRAAGTDSRSYLADRLQAPDLFLAASLESELHAEDEKAALDTCIAFYQRAAKLNVNTKLNSFLGNADVIQRNAELLQQAASPPVPSATTDFMDSVVNAAVLKITPADKDHLNGTFAFAKSVGFSREKVALSIADGCFQTLRSLLQPAGTLTPLAVQKLQADGRISILSANASRQDKVKNGCPFFSRMENGDAVQFLCPFAEAADQSGNDQGQVIGLIHQQCRKDKVHLSNIN